MYAVTSKPLVSRTRATFRSAEFGFLGVVVYTRVHTPRFCGLLRRAGAFSFFATSLRPCRTSWLMVGISSRTQSSLATPADPKTGGTDLNHKRGLGVRSTGAVWRRGGKHRDRPRGLGGPALRILEGYDQHIVPSRLGRQLDGHVFQGPAVGGQGAVRVPFQGHPLRRHPRPPDPPQQPDQEGLGGHVLHRDSDVIVAHSFISRLETVGLPHDPEVRARRHR